MEWKYEPPPPRLDADKCGQVRQRLAMAVVAERYGFTVTKGRIICPFHDDTKPSCVVYPGDRGFYCYACNAGGSVLDFVGKLFGLTWAEAAARLDGDFGLGLGSAPVDEAKLWALRQQRQEKERARRLKAYFDAAMALAARGIRGLPPPATHACAAKYGAEKGRLAYLEYLFEESVYPD